MTKAQEPKVIVWPKLGTFFDLRSNPDGVPWGRWRLVENMAVVDGVFQRRCGWRRFGHWMDLSDDADLSTRTVAEPIDVLYQHLHPTGHRRLFAASRTVVYSQFHDGLWRTLLTFQAGGIRPHFASVGQTVFVTNNHTRPLYHVLDEEPDEEGQAFHPIKDLDKIGLQQAGMVASWQGILFLGDVVMDHVRVGHRVIWSDRENPLKFEPATDNVAGFQDLDPGEVVLAAVPMSDAIFFFTTRSIWRATLVGGNFLLNFQQVYVNRTGIGCLMARDSLVVWRNTAIYFAADGLYLFNAYATTPEQPTWMYHASKRISDVDTGICERIISGLRASYGEVWVSYPLANSPANNRTLVLNMDYEAADEIDHGFTAMLPIQPDDSIEVYDWMISAGGCGSADVEEVFPGSSEGRPVIPANPKSIEEFCGDPANFPDCTQCPQLERFVVASALDGNLKDVDAVYFARDQKVLGAFTNTGYGSRFVTGAVHFDKTDWKRIENIQFDVVAPATDAPRDLNLTISVSGTPVDVLAPICRAKSFVLKPRKLECPGKEWAEGQPNAHLRWPVLVEGRYVFLDFSMPVVTGGAFFASRIAITLSMSPNSTL